MTLEDTLKFNEDAIRRLKEQLKSSRKTIPFIGAGMGAFRFKLWRAYLMHHAHLLGLEVEMNNLLDKEAFEEAGELLLDKMGSHIFNEEIENEYGIHKLSDFVPSAHLLALPKLTNGPVITTNYDEILELTFKVFGRAFEERAFGAKISAVRRVITRDANVLLKIHGDATEITDRILSKSEYLQHYGDDGANGFDPNLPLPKILTKLMSGTPLLFLGCSLVNDRTFKVLTWSFRDAEHSGHFAILPLPSTGKDNAHELFLRKSGIKPIWYDPENNHEMLAKLILHLVEDKEISSDAVTQKPLLETEIFWDGTIRKAGKLVGNLTKEKYKDRALLSGEGIFSFEVTWDYKLRITNNSTIPAINLKLIHKEGTPQFLSVDHLNAVNNLAPLQHLDLKAKVTRTFVVEPPEIMEIEKQKVPEFLIGLTYSIHYSDAARNPMLHTFTIENSEMSVYT